MRIYFLILSLVLVSCGKQSTSSSAKAVTPFPSEDVCFVINDGLVSLTQSDSSMSLAPSCKTLDQLEASLDRAQLIAAVVIAACVRYPLPQTKTLRMTFGIAGVASKVLEMYIKENRDCVDEDLTIEQKRINQAKAIKTAENAGAVFVYAFEVAPTISKSQILFSEMSTGASFDLGSVSVQNLGEIYPLSGGTVATSPVYEKSYTDFGDPLVSIKYQIEVTYGATPTGIAANAGKFVSNVRLKIVEVKNGGLSSGFGFSPSYRLGVSLKNLLPSGPTSANIDAKATLELEWAAPFVVPVIDQFDLQGSGGIVQTRLGASVIQL